MKKRLFLVHGRNFKPDEPQLDAIWTEALRHGIEADHGPEKAKTFDEVDKKLVYYGELSNAFLRSEGQDYDAEADLADRQKALAALKAYDRDDLEGERAKAIYKDLPKNTALLEALADAVAGPAAFLGLGRRLIPLVAPDLGHYWNLDSAFGSDVRWTLTEPLAEALRNDEDVLLLAHSLGSMMSYDVLWKFSHYGEYKAIRHKKISVWITLGCPLGNGTVKKNLKGARADRQRRYPHNIQRWINVAAEDDYISHDETVADDYRRMLRWNLIESIEDHRVYNLAVRFDRSNPHHSGGYLIHPVVSAAVAEWLG